jgi:hypothetical protein
VLASARVQPQSRIVRLVVVALVGLLFVAAIAVVGPAARAPMRAELVVARADGLHRLRPGVSDKRIAGTRHARAPAWAPNGRELAYERNGTVYIANRDGSGVRPLLAGSEPDWSHDGRFLVASRGGAIIIARRNGGAVRRLTAGPGDAHPTWSPDGRRIAFTRDGVVMVARASGADAAAVADGTDPAWSPDGTRIAFVSASGIASVRPGVGDVVLHTADPAHRSPSFSLDRSELVFASAGRLFTVPVAGGEPRALTAGTSADAAFVPSRAELLPDLDQRAPAKLGVSYTGGRYRLGFASAVDNVGAGPLWVRGIRSGPRMQMRGLQLVRTSGGGTETHREAGTLRYTFSPAHSHWHLLDFVRYELRRASDFKFLVRDRKTGFCLGDHYGHARRVRPVRPFFRGNCGPGNRTLRRIDQGSSRGYTDRYSAHIHGQDVDLTGVRTGVYVLVHRANPQRLLRERRYDNNAASVRIRIVRQPGGAPTVRVLRTCEGTERC